MGKFLGFFDRLVFERVVGHLRGGKKVKSKKREKDQKY